MVIRQNICHGLTPSSRAASTMSPGIALIAAESTTMAKPAWIQTMMTMSSRVFSGESSSHCLGSPPRLTTIWLSRPIWSCPSPR